MLPSTVMVVLVFFGSGLSFEALREASQFILNCLG
jgi:hypothetical protein